MVKAVSRLIDLPSYIFDQFFLNSIVYLALEKADKNYYIDISLKSSSALCVNICLAFWLFSNLDFLILVIFQTLFLLSLFRPSKLSLTSSSFDFIGCIWEDVLSVCVLLLGDQWGRGKDFVLPFLLPLRGAGLWLEQIRGDLVIIKNKK